MFLRLLPRRGPPSSSSSSSGWRRARATMEVTPDDPGRSRRWISVAPRLWSHQLKMPSLSPTMTEGTIVKWLKKEGEEVQAGDVLCEIQTDKAVVSLEHDDDGTLAKIVKEQDSGAIQVGELIAVIAEDGEDWQEVAKAAPAAGEAAGEVDEGATTTTGQEEEEDAAGPSGGSTPAILMNMPALSPTMTEGTIVKWCKQEGDPYKPGDVICEIQTDKAVVSMEADDDGVLAKIMVPEGEAGVKVGQLIALSVEEGEDWKDVQIPAPEKKPKAEKKDEPAAATPKAAAEGQVGEHKFVHVANVGPATNLLMTQYGIDPSDVSPSGPKGLLKSDVLAHIENKGLKPIKPREAEAKKAEPTDAAPAKARKPSSGYTDHPLSSMRAVIAKRLSQSKQTSPHGHCTARADIRAIQAIRKDYAEAGFKVSVNDLLIKAVAAALQHCPEMNLNVSGEDFKIMQNIDISVAVATDAGLITPIVTDVPSRSLVEVAEAVRDLAKRAREGKLQLSEFQGGTFTISNLGMFGIHEFTAIINPPQVGILAVGSGTSELDPETGKSGTFMRSTLSFDRRFVDEALAADFMSTLRTVIERPEYMNLGFVPVARKRTSN